MRGCEKHEVPAINEQTNHTRREIAKFYLIRQYMPTSTEDESHGFPSITS